MFLPLSDDMIVLLYHLPIIFNPLLGLMPLS